MILHQIDSIQKLNIKIKKNKNILNFLINKFIKNFIYAFCLNFKVCDFKFV